MQNRFHGHPPTWLHEYRLLTPERQRQLTGPDTPDDETEVVTQVERVACATPEMRADWERMVHEALEAQRREEHGGGHGGHGQP